MMLPYSIGIRATIRLGVKGPLETGKVRSSFGLCCIMLVVSGVEMPDMLLPHSIGIPDTIRPGVKRPLETGRVSSILWFCGFVIVSIHCCHTAMALVLYAAAAYVGHSTLIVFV
jgi:hypothetical protein